MRGMPLFVVLVMTLTSGAMAQLPLDRGVQVRKILLDAMEQSSQNGGTWPRQPAGLTDALVYQSLSSPMTDDIAGATVVLHESIAGNSNGAWVGYADGHLEFAADAAALAECEDQLKILKTAPIVRSRQSQNSKPLKLKILDPAGNPAAGVLIGKFGQFGDSLPDEPRVYFSVKNHDAPIISDANGLATIPAESVFGPGAGRFSLNSSAPIYMIDESRGLVALEEMTQADFTGDNPREIHLHPGCHVIGDIFSLGLHSANRPLTRVHAFAFKAGSGLEHAINSDFNSGQFNFFLPPGDYCLAADGSDCDYARRYVHIAPGQKELKIQLDIPAYAFADFFGKPAPELRDIKGWKNGNPIKLNDLRGKIVLLDFWGFWCDTCWAAMPTLMKIHDEFKDKGLVIVGLHDDSAASFTEIDQRLTNVRNRLWGGRDLPFLLALDGGGPIRITHSTIVARGATTAAYGIMKFPTTLVIGRDGTFLDEIDIESQGARDRIQKLLDSK